MSTDAASRCPFHGQGITNKEWWPNQLDLSRLHRNSEVSNPLAPHFDYGAAFEALDLAEVKHDIEAAMTTSQSWWPADYGHYGPFFIRLAWHSAGTYRISDGRGGAGAGLQRFAPLNSWPDNANLDKARRLLWPVKQKYGQALSWADLMVLAGNVALESMGFQTFGFAGGREDVWEPDDTYWGSETAWLADERYSGDRDLADPLAAVQMGLIYVNPEGPNGVPDPLAAARDIRETFRRMAMNDEETVALIAGGHSFGKAHGAVPADGVGPEPEGAGITEQGFGWTSSTGTGHGADTITSGLEGAWTADPIRWDNGFFDNLFGDEWELTTSPAGAQQWRPVGGAGEGTVPDAHGTGRTHAPMMLTTDLALRFDPAYEVISRRFHQNPAEFADAFARAWFKLTHRDMGPSVRGRGVEVPAEPQIWQDPVPPVTHRLVDADEARELKKAILAAGLSPRQLVWTAWAAASTFRTTDKRGGVNGARIRLAPQKDWEANDPTTVSAALDALEAVKRDFEAGRTDGTQVSIADLIVLAGNAGVEEAARLAGFDVEVPFTPGRTDATDEQTDAESFAVLEPLFDGFRNHVRPGLPVAAEELLVEKAALMGLTAPQTTVLVGGLRALGVTTPGTQHGVLSDRPGTLSNDVFVNLLDMGTVWTATSPEETEFVGRDRTTGQRRWTATRVDLVFGSNSVLRALAEVYASDDARETFVRDFVAAWTTVMELDRFDLR